MANKKILLAGLYDTGKTTFIAALWYMLYYANDKSCLKIGSLSEGDHEYLNEIRDKWMKYEKVLRTSQQKLGGEKIVINVLNNSNGETITLNIPDFSGETFKHHYDNREWTEEFNDIIKQTDGLMVFVNPTQDNNMPNLVVKENEYVSMFGELPNNDGVTLLEYDPAYTPNQVKIVEELQFFEKYAELQFPIRVAVMISMWDKVENVYNSDILPEEWLKLQLPLLYQYLKCNNSLFTVSFYGISAQGGDYIDRDNLADIDMMERVIVKEGSVIGNDITKPILWAAE